MVPILIMRFAYELPFTELEFAKVALVALNTGGGAAVAFAMSDGEHEELQGMLRSLVAERGKVREAMGWCITRSQYAADIVETVTEALTIAATPPPKKIARLYLVSDLLHNSSAAVPNASAYRTAFEATLPTIFASVHSCRAALDSRMAQQTFGEQAAKLLRVWGAWSEARPDIAPSRRRVGCWRRAA